MQLKTLIKTLNIIAPIVIVGGITSITVVAILGVNTKFDYPYNYLVSDFSKSDAGNDITANSFYTKNTASVFVAPNVGKGSMGTIWNWPSEAIGYYYFATNIHVVNKALKYKGTSSLDFSEQFELNHQYLFRTYDDRQNIVLLENVELAHLSISDQTLVRDSNYMWNNDVFYTDLAVLKTTTRIFSEDNTLDFIDTPAELSDITRNPAIYDYYVAGYPATSQNSGWPAAANWTTAKYHWSTMQGSIYTDGPSMGTSASLFGVTNYLNDNTLGLDIATFKGRSYARQLILPGLNIDGGSSGSLVSVWHENKLKPLGIYWGVYIADNDVYYGAVDLFYTTQYPLYYGKGNIPSMVYSHLPNQPWTQSQIN